MNGPMEVPTVRELAELGSDYAVAVAWDADGKATKWRTFAKGHALLGDIMKHNALLAIANGETAWTQPPSRTDLGGVRAP
jgi:hypothetical protein